MNELQKWAQRWGVSEEALDDLRERLGAVSTPAQTAVQGAREEVVKQNVRLAAAKSPNLILWRNNVGACISVDGRPVRYGLCNDSKQMNERIKSSDLIGIRRVRITDEHVGQLLGVFVALECKRGGWVYRGTKHEVAQYHFIKLVETYGGEARFTTGELCDTYL